MPLSSFISDLYSSLTVSDVHAEAPPAAEPEAEEPAKDEKKEEPAAVAAAEEEEEEEEPEDPFPSLLQGRRPTYLTQWVVWGHPTPTPQSGGGHG